MKKHLLSLAALALISLSAAAVPPPTPFGPVPNTRQITWAKETDLYAMFNFSLNTYTGREWGFGNESVAKFNPKQFDAAQIVAAAKAAGCKGIIIDAKHHCGFCLWPSQFNDHYTVKNSPWKGGKGDMVKELADACRAAGVKVGIYLSPWDRNHKDYGKPAYATYYHNQLRELLTHYGPLFELWFDNANGGDGWYGGAKGKRTIGPNYYQWEVVEKMVRELQPNAAIFETGPTSKELRWNGNEKGLSGDPCWATIKQAGQSTKNERVYLTHGERGGDHWWPAEADFPLLAHAWFWNNHTRTRSPAELVDIYFHSVGRNSSMDIGIAPDTRGLLTGRDIAALKGFGERIRAIFATNLAASATFTASNTRGNDAAFAPKNALDGWTTGKYWATDDGVLTPELVTDFGKPTTFSVISLREQIALGHRVDDWALDAWQGDAKTGAWQEFAKGTAIGMRNLWRGKPITTDKIRLRITKAAACPAIAEFAAYLDPQATGKTVAPVAPVAKDETSLAKTGWKILSASSEGTPAANAIDGKPEALWHTQTAAGPQACPQEIVVDMGKTHTLTGFLYLPRQDASTAGNIAKYAFHVSSDGKNWGKSVAQGEFGNILANPVQQNIRFAKPIAARYFKFTDLEPAQGDGVSAAEIGVFGK